MFPRIFIFLKSKALVIVRTYFQGRLLQLEINANWAVHNVNL
jgi:hypothetical protein